MPPWSDALVFVAPNSKVPPRPKDSESPYFGTDEGDWGGVTRSLLKAHPLSATELRSATLESWNDIFRSTIGPARIGVDIKPAPQVMGFLLHELIPLQIAQTEPDWRRDASSSEKDLVYVPDSQFSLEIKTSSHKDQVFGNRSFGVEGAPEGKKAKSGYYLTVNFEKWSEAGARRPEIQLIRFGWIDHTDWRAQAAATGQNSTLAGATYGKQLAVIYRRPKGVRSAGDSV